MSGCAPRKIPLSQDQKQMKPESDPWVPVIHKHSFDPVYLADVESEPEGIRAVITPSNYSLYMLPVMPQLSYHEYVKFVKNNSN